jgi:hypothetical protein
MPAARGCDLHAALIDVRIVSPLARLRRLAMAVVLVHQGPSLTQERYEETVRRLTGGSGRLESPADWPVEGLLVHIAGEAESGFRVVDVWESEDACRRFGEKLSPILKEVGIEDGPDIYPIHTFVKA